MMFNQMTALKKANFYMEVLNMNKNFTFFA